MVGWVSLLPVKTGFIISSISSIGCNWNSLTNNFQNMQFLNWRNSSYCIWVSATCAWNREVCDNVLDTDRYVRRTTVRQYSDTDNNSVHYTDSCCFSDDGEDLFSPCFIDSELVFTRWECYRHLLYVGKKYENELNLSEHVCELC